VDHLVCYADNNEHLHYRPLFREEIASGAGSTLTVGCRMKPASLTLCLFTGFTPVALAQEKPAAFSVSYTHAGLVEIIIKDGKLHYVWHTERRRDDGKPLDQSNVESYDRHQVDIWLTDKELVRVRQWATQHKLFEFDKDYPSPPGSTSRGGAFQSGLSIVQGDKKHAISWAGDSNTPKALGVAVAELIVLTDEIQRSRNK